jgi:L-alanine-DL-glutamate epimerase-like enolase superfamily enzyme
MSTRGGALGGGAHSAAAAAAAAASLHLAAAAESFLTFECMVFDNPLRQALTVPVAGDVGGLRADGTLAVPDAPGLGVTLAPGALNSFRITA